jgi:uncharacterized C2H2 Zn-finger protein
VKLRDKMEFIQCPEDRRVLLPMWDGESMILECPLCGLQFEWDNLEEREQLKLKEKHSVEG